MFLSGNSSAVSLQNSLHRLKAEIHDVKGRTIIDCLIRRGNKGSNPRFLLSYYLTPVGAGRPAPRAPAGAAPGATDGVAGVSW
jgi:hypothetical protein